MWRLNDGCRLISTLLGECRLSLQGREFTMAIRLSGGTILVEGKSKASS